MYFNEVFIGRHLEKRHLPKGNHPSNKYIKNGYIKNNYRCINIKQKRERLFSVNISPQFPSHLLLKICCPKVAKAHCILSTLYTICKLSHHTSTFRSVFSLTDVSFILHFPTIFKSICIQLCQPVSLNSFDLFRMMATIWHSISMLLNECSLPSGIMLALYAVGRSLVPGRVLPKT